VKFTSLDSFVSEETTGAKPLSPHEIGATAGPLDPRDFVDPRGWSTEIASPDGMKANPNKTLPLEESDLPEIASLEQMLEGEGALITTAALPVQKKKKSLWRKLIIALLLFVILGAAAVFILHHFDLLKSGETNDNDKAHLFLKTE